MKSKKTPLTYTEEEVTFINDKVDIELSGTLTLPSAKVAPYPVVVLIAGSGPMDRDETVCGHKPFFVLADYLARNGIAILRYDKRGVSKSTGNLYTATVMDLVDDVIAAIKYLENRKDLYSKSISLVGHSEGGILAPIVATKEASVKTIVLMAGSCLLGEDILYLQNKLVLAAEGKSKTAINKKIFTLKNLFAVIKKENDASIAEKKVREIITAEVNDLSEDEKKLIKDVDGYIDAQVKLMASPWFRSFLTYNPAPALTQVKCPVLAINGTKDLQVPYKENLTAIKTALKNGGNKKHLIVKMNGLNHLFQKTKTGAVSEYSQIKETIAPTVLKIIGDWILRNC